LEAVFKIVKKRVQARLGNIVVSQKVVAGVKVRGRIEMFFPPVVEVVPERISKLFASLSLIPAIPGAIEKFRLG
jgi:hypothetical protein